MDALIFHNESKHVNSDLDGLVYQHIESGYYELSQHIQQYKQLLDKYGFAKNKCLPKVGSSPRAFLREGEELTKEGKELEKKREEIDSLRTLIFGLIYRQIIEPTKEDQPLLGGCDQCPLQIFSIKD